MLMHRTGGANIQHNTKTIRVIISKEENAAYYKVATGCVVEMELSEYLRGVVAAEVGNAPLEACKAQAVASRTSAARAWWTPIRAPSPSLRRSRTRTRRDDHGGCRLADVRRVHDAGARGVDSFGQLRTAELLQKNARTPPFFCAVFVERGLTYCNKYDIIKPLKRGKNGARHRESLAGAFKSD